MKTEQDAPGATAEGARDGGSRCRSGDRGRWWDRPDAWDPERWKAMATAWKSMFEDDVDGPRPQQPAPATKTCPYCAEDIRAAALKCKHCGTWLVPPPEPFASSDGPTSGWAGCGPYEGLAPSRRLTRSRDDAMACGVLGGVARYFGFDSTWLRIAYALGTFFTALLPGLIVYGILAFIMPADASAKGPSLE